MQRAIRWAVCLVVAAASTPVFADGDDAMQAQPSDDQAATTETSATDDAGSGGREPMPRATLAPDAGAADDAAARLQHDDFVAQIWNSP